MKLLSGLVSEISSVVDTLAVSSKEKKQIEADLVAAIARQEEALSQSQSSIIQAEAQGNWLEQDVFSIIRTKAESEFKGDLSVRVGMDALAGKVKNMYDKPTDNEEVGVTLTIPIFDWGAKKAKVKSSQLAMESDEISLEEQKKEIVIDVRQICRNLPTLIRQIEIKKKSIENAERTYEINLEKYRNGNLTGMDLQQFQNQLTTAKQDYTSAIISYKIELLNLKIQTLWDFETHKSYLPVDLLK